MCYFLYIVIASKGKKYVQKSFQAFLRRRSREEHFLKQTYFDRKNFAKTTALTILITFKVF